MSEIRDECIHNRDKCQDNSDHPVRQRSRRFSVGVRVSMDRPTNRIGCTEEVSATSGVAVGLKLEDLEVARKFMLDEIEMDVKSEKIYLSR
jgi:hypothetical protein